MTLKSATSVVLVCLGLSLLWSLVAFALPYEALRGVYQSKLPSLVVMAKDIALLLFFVTLFRNQR